MALRRLSVRRAPWHRAAPPTCSPSWLVADARLACAEPGLCVCPEQAVRGDDWLQVPLFPDGEVHDEPDHPVLFVEYDGLFDLVLPNEDGPKRKRKRKPNVYPQCPEEGCKSQGRVRGRCQRHRSETVIKRARLLCSDQGCDSKARGASGLCRRHGGEIQKPAKKVKEAKVARTARETRGMAEKQSYLHLAKAEAAQPVEARLSISLGEGVRLALKVVSSEKESRLRVLERGLEAHRHGNNIRYWHETSQRLRDPYWQQLMREALAAQPDEQLVTQRPQLLQLLLRHAVEVHAPVLLPTNEVQAPMRMAAQVYTLTLTVTLTHACRARTYAVKGYNVHSFTTTTSHTLAGAAPRYP